MASQIGKVVADFSAPKGNKETGCFKMVSAFLSDFKLIYNTTKQ